MSADTTSPIDRIESALHRLDLRQKVRLLTGASFWATHSDELIGLGALSLSDGPAGVRGGGWDERRTSLLLPCPAALAATWDGDLAREYGAVLGRRARAAGVHVLLAPTVNLQRSPRGGRNFESMGEDPVLAARMAVGYVAGVQSVGVAATVKHFAGNEVETNRMHYDVRASIDLLRATYLLPFESAVREAGAWAVMAAYNAVNGASMTENQELLDGVLRDDWGFDGLVVSDWGATASTVPSAEASLDLVMPGPDGPWAERLLDAVRRGEVDADVIDAKVRRLLRLAERVGAWPVSGQAGDADRRDPVDRDADDTLARQLAAAGSVLLKHTGVLPLNASAHRRVALIGSAALDLSLQGGGSAHVEPERRSTLADDLAAALGPDVAIEVVAGPPISRYAPDVAEFSSDPLSGKPGIRLEYVDGEGHTVDSEHRSRGRLVLLPDDLPHGARAVRIRAQVDVDVDGEHGLELCGSGTFDVQVAGSLSDRVVIAGPSDDPVLALSKPPSQRLSLSLRAGSVVDIEITYSLPSDGLVALRVGWARPESNPQDVIATAARVAASCDLAIVVVGTTDEVESEGFDRADLSLPAPQDDLVRAVANANPRTIVVVNAGSPVLLPWADDCAEIVWAWLPGQAGAGAIADVLTGVAEPAGRLPMTIPHPDQVDSSALGAGDDLDYDAQPEIGYRRYASGGTPPHFPFGFGLGYTTWAYESATLNVDGASVDVTITNTGLRRGREVVQCYAVPVADPTEPPRLVGFASAAADVGDTVTVSVPLDLRPMSTWDSRARGWVHSSVGWNLIVGRHVGDERFRVAYS